MEPILREFREEDVPKLAQMWRESDSAWPGGFMDGAEVTDELVREWETQEDPLSRHLIEWDDRIVGYCTVVEQAGHPEYAYLETLNVSPDCHGKGFGRMLIHRAVEDAIDRRLRMFSIDTWPANVKSVPLYKKTGFCWVPETTVFMENYVPQIVNTPMARPYFDRHDWYATMVRELDQAPDELAWHGKKVFAYHWEADHDLLDVMIDKEVRWITAFENNDFAVAAFVGAENVPAGIPQVITWEFKNKTDHPIAVTLLAEGEDTGVDCARQEHFLLEDCRTIMRPFALSPQFEEKEGEITHHLIKSDLVIDGQPLTLRSGFKACPPVAVRVDFPVSPARKGRAMPMTVCLRNDHKQAFAGVVRVVPDPRIELDRYETPFSVDAESETGAPFVLTVVDEGAIELKVYTVIDRDGETMTTEPEPFPVLAPPLGGAVGYVGKKEVLLANEDIEVVVPLRGHEFRIRDRHGRDGCAVVHTRGQVGPPYPAPYMDRRKCAAQLTHVPGSVTCTLAWNDNRFPGLGIEKRISVTALPVVMIEDRFLNASAQSYRLDVKHHAAPRVPRADKVTIPLKAGLVSDRCGTGEPYPGANDIPREPDAYAEEWIALERDGVATGLLWRDAKRVIMGRGLWMEVTRPVPELAPGACAALAPLYAFVGPGTWRTVRGWWQKLIGDGIDRADVPADPEPHLCVETVPTPLAMTERRIQTQLRLRRHSQNPMSGELRLDLPADWAADEGQWTFQDVKLGAPFATPLTLVAPADAGPGVYQIQATRRGEATDTMHTLPVIVLGHRADVEVTETDGTVTVANGRLTLRVAPTFYGGLYSLDMDGSEHLFSAYPEPGNLGWMRPWHGGVHPFVHWNPGELYKEAFEWEQVECIGTQGVAWHGVRVRCTPTHKTLRGLRLEVSYLTTGGSNVVAVPVRYVNATPAPRDFTAGLVAFFQPGGTRDNLRGVVERAGTLYHKKPTIRAGRLHGDDWVALRNPAGDDVAVLVSAGDRRELTVDDMGQDGPHLRAAHSIRLEPGAEVETICYLVLTKGLEAARAYRVLKGLKELP